jgi:acyl-CoA synthetase (AMP-forming)/AMP-acid ligase II
MLYDRWREIARSRPDELAITEVPSAREWTFGELAHEAEQAKPWPNLPQVAFPQGNNAEFVLSVLRAWRLGQVVCPLEAAQAIPHSFASLPAGTCHLKTTSASTGSAKFVAFAESQLAADAENIVNTMGLRPDWPNVAAISLAHSYGFSNLVLPLLLHGVPLVLAGSALPEALRQAVNARPNVTLPGVPALWRTWHDSGAISPRIRLAISAGAPLPLGLEQSIFALHGLKVHNFYGSSECGGIAYDAAAGPRTDGSCAGSAMQGVEARIAADGCIEVSGAAVGTTYWPEPSASLQSGVFRTSDLGEIAFGMIYLRGRAGDQINVAGRKVLPEVIERALTGHPMVSDCLVFGVASPGSERGEQIVACVVRKDGLAAESLRDFLLSRLADWQIPREIVFVDSLAANERGKLPRAEWRKRYLTDRAPAPAT